MELPRKINLLVTLDERYVPPLFVLLRSLFLNNPGVLFHIYVVHADITPRSQDLLRRFCARAGSVLEPVSVPPDMFADAPVFRHYTKAMYYRLLACELLPEQVDRVLYLDPDILNINPIGTLYSADLKSKLFGAAMHTGFTNIKGHINRVRLAAYEAEGYYNSGVLLMDLARQRRRVRREEVFAYVRQHEKELILPDQDILNGLYGGEILPLDDSLYNYDARRFETYRLVSAGVKDMAWVMNHTVLLHFCGKSKPWQRAYHNRFGSLYRHYASLAGREQQAVGGALSL